MLKAIAAGYPRRAASEGLQHLARGRVAYPEGSPSRVEAVRSALDLGAVLQEFGHFRLVLDAPRLGRVAEPVQLDPSLSGEGDALVDHVGQRRVALGGLDEARIRLRGHSSLPRFRARQIYHEGGWHRRGWVIATAMQAVG